MTNQHVYFIDPDFASPHPSGHLKHFSEAPLPLLLGRHPLASLDRVVVGFKGQWGRLEFAATEDAQEEKKERSSGAIRRASPSFEEEEEGRGGGEGRAPLLVAAAASGDPIVCVGYTLVTRDKAQTFRLLNTELRVLANEAKRRGQGRGGGGREKEEKVAIENAEEEAVAALGGSGLKYHGLIYQWSKKKGPDLLLPRTVLVTEDDELVIAVEDLRQDVSLPLPPTAAEAAAEGSNGSSRKFTPSPVPGEQTTVLLRLPLSQVVAVEEEAADPRHITLTVQEGLGGGKFGLPLFKGMKHTWRLYAEDRRQIDALIRVVRDGGM